MNFTLTRKDFSPDGIFGELFDDRNKISLVTLEHSFDNAPKLPNGDYTCQRGIHRLHDNIPFEAFEIMNVPGHTGILFHIGNYNKDSDGCVLVGMDRNNAMIEHSAIAFSKLMGLLEGQNSFSLTVTSE